MVQRIDASILIERQKRSAFLAGLIVMICITAFLEGFDAQIQGYTAPAITKLWHIDQAAFSPVFVSFQFALLAGALSLANLGDIYGRRPVIVFCVALFGIFTAAGALAHDVPTLAATRFLSAIFLGGAMPNAIALTVDYAPQGKRAFRVGILYVVYATGGSLGGFLSAWLVPALGWQSIYWLCGAVALAYSLLLYLFLPESLRHMILRGRSPAKIAALAGRLDPALAGVEATYVLPKSVPRKAWVGELFAEKRGLMTVLLWAAYVCNMLALQFNTAWMPTIFASAGVSYSKSVVATSLFQGGGALGSLSIGWLMDREKGLLRLCVLGLIAAPIFLVIGHSAGQAGLLMLLASMVGFCIIGSQTGINATAGFLYPTALRATGVGWAYGVGRIGSITGPILGAALLSLHVSFPTMFLVAAIPPLLVSLLMFGVYLTQRGRPRPSQNP